MTPDAAEQHHTALVYELHIAIERVQPEWQAPFDQLVHSLEQITRLKWLSPEDLLDQKRMPGIFFHHKTFPLTKRLAQAKINLRISRDQHDNQT